jgi:hypothetical protein
MTGLGLKIRGRTSRGAIELRVLVGPIIASEPAFTYSYESPNPNNIWLHTINVAAKATIGFGFSPGISLGYKLTQHLGLMANADMLFAQLIFKTSKSTYDPVYIMAPTPITIISSMAYLHLTGGLIYTLGKMTPNIVY